MALLAGKSQTTLMMTPIPEIVTTTMAIFIPSQPLITFPMLSIQIGHQNSSETKLKKS